MNRTSRVRAVCEITLPTGKSQWEVVFARTYCAAAAELTAHCAQGSGRFLYEPDEDLKSAPLLLVLF